jgi:IclR family acetate operon transcriptional repressor
MDNPPRSSERRKYPSPGAAIAADVLVVLSLTAPSGIQLRELARSLNTPRSTLHRVLQTLEAKGMVKRVEGAGYLIGDETRRLGSRFRLKELPRVAAPILDEVHRETGESVNLAVAEDDAMVVVASVHSSERLRTVTTVGTRDLLHASALGKAYLSALPDEELRRALKGTLAAPTPGTIVNRTALLKELRTARARGFAIDDEESVVGVRCVGAAIFGEDEAPVGAISVMGPTSRLRLEDVQDISRPLVRAARQLSGLMGSSRRPGDG